MKKGFGFKKKTEQSVNSGRHSSDVKSNPVRMGVIVMITGFLGLVLWVALAPLDEGVPCDGVVSIATKSKVIQHLYGGIVKNVYVREGLLVHEGDSLMSLDKSSVNAAYEEVSQHYLGLRASESRLIAEQKGLVSIVFHNDLVSASDKALVGSLIENQKRLFSSRQDLRRILQKQLDGIRDLVKEGYAPLEQQWELERRLAEMDASVASDLAGIRMQVDAYAEKTQALAEQLERTEIRTPVDGQVMGLKVQSPGAVIRPGDEIMEIVPLEKNLLIEVKIAPHLIDRISPGLFADVRFSAFSHSPSWLLKVRWHLFHRIC